MSDLLQASPRSGHNGGPPDPPDNRPFFKPQPCPECKNGKLFVPRMAGQLFCCPAHRDAWNNRQTKRGRVLTSLALVARQTRNGTRGSPTDRATGKRAAADHHRLTQRYRNEDRDEGRMSHPEYLTRRYDAGYAPE